MSIFCWMFCAGDRVCLCVLNVPANVVALHLMQFTEFFLFEILLESMTIEESQIKCSTQPQCLGFIVLQIACRSYFVSFILWQSILEAADDLFLLGQIAEGQC